MYKIQIFCLKNNYKTAYDRIAMLHFFNRDHQGHWMDWTLGSGCCLYSVTVYVLPISMCFFSQKHAAR